MKNFIALICMCFVLSCTTDQSDIDSDRIESYLTDNGLEATVVTDSGMHIIIEDEGGTNKPNTNNTITIHYTGTYIDGVKFDSSFDRGEAYTQPLRNLIGGWQEGIPYFGIGGKGTLLIPSNLGYGSNPQNGIRKNAVLVFDIELIDFN